MKKQILFLLAFMPFICISAKNDRPAEPATEITATITMTQANSDVYLDVIGGAAYGTLSKPIQRATVEAPAGLIQTTIFGNSINFYFDWNMWLSLGSPAHFTGWIYYTDNTVAKLYLTVITE